MTQKKSLKTIGILTSGGDCPGMNCSIRAIVRTAIGEGIRVKGIEGGYAGIFKENIINLSISSVGNIIQRGGTILRSSRCLEFHEKSFRKKAAVILKRHGIDALVVMGGNGTFAGAHIFNQEHGIPVVGIPGTIDNDIMGTEYSIGFDTAIQTAMEAVDKIRDTAFSHNRNFLIEVMGRKSPAIALKVGVCSGAENIILNPEEEDLDQVVKDIKRGIKRGKKSSIIIVAEGEEPGLSYALQAELKEKYKIDSTVCILGHIQRGGSPTAFDRFMASKMGFMAVKALIAKNYPSVTIYKNGRVTIAPLKKCLDTKKKPKKEALELIRALSI
ncbi:MAG: 6-phosphofructokinase [Epsilonproteobacteria bacterium]|nr:MAG: 6-phosphofructokinase [Campylobacterota bacterium]RLA67875.1 MAG: 6-phosphofructokinase [Campylobacterota bacterium]